MDISPDGENSTQAFKKVNCLQIDKIENYNITATFVSNDGYIDDNENPSKEDDSALLHRI